MRLPLLAMMTRSLLLMLDSLLIRGAPISVRSMAMSPELLVVVIFDCEEEGGEWGQAGERDREREICQYFILMMSQCDRGGYICMHENPSGELSHQSGPALFLDEHWHTICLWGRQWLNNLIWLQPHTHTHTHAHTHTHTPHTLCNGPDAQQICSMNTNTWTTSVSSGHSDNF